MPIESTGPSAAEGVQGDGYRLGQRRKAGLMPSTTELPSLDSKRAARAAGAATHVGRVRA
jgi:hypothetical protein